MSSATYRELALPQSLSNMGRCRTYPKRTYIYRPTDRMESIFIIHSGQVKIGSYDPDGHEVVYDLAGPGDFFGNLKYLGNTGTFQEFVRTVTDVEVEIFDLRSFKEVVAAHPPVQEWLSRMMVVRWSRAESRLFRISALPPRERLLKVLGEIDDDAVAARKLLTQSDLANLTGLARQTVAKLLREM